ncbi:MAG: hypothetical protein LBH36_00770 [Candidatus Nomurabacteria bacterium]|nr:hypothetical protein [Candidatus Nomurabacteria bacterium]
MKRTFSINIITNGPGKPFAIAAIVYDENGNEIARFAGRCLIWGEIHPSIQEIFPVFTSRTGRWIPGLDPDIVLPVTHLNYSLLIAAFKKFCVANKTSNGDVVIHTGIPKELLHIVNTLGLGVDINLLLGIGISVGDYNASNGITVIPTESNGGTRSPLYYASQNAVAYQHICASR